MVFTLPLLYKYIATKSAPNVDNMARRRSLPLSFMAMPSGCPPVSHLCPLFLWQGWPLCAHDAVMMSCMQTHRTKHSCLAPLAKHLQPQHRGLPSTTLMITRHHTTVVSKRCSVASFCVPGLAVRPQQGHPRFVYAVSDGVFKRFQDERLAVLGCFLFEMTRERRLVCSGVCSSSVQCIPSSPP